MKASELALVRLRAEVAELRRAVEGSNAHSTTSRRRTMRLVFRGR
jgi:hypothetical protein